VNNVIEKGKHTAAGSNITEIGKLL